MPTGLRDPDSKVKIRGQVVTFSTHDLNAISGTPEADSLTQRQLNIAPPYADIRHLLYSNRSTVRWVHHGESGLYLIFPYAQINRKAHM